MWIGPQAGAHDGWSPRAGLAILSRTVESSSMPLRLVPGSTAGEHRHRRPPTTGTEAQVRLIDCHSDLYERLQAKSARPRRRYWKIAALLLLTSILMAIVASAIIAGVASAALPEWLPADQMTSLRPWSRTTASPSQTGAPITRTRRRSPMAAERISMSMVKPRLRRIACRRSASSLARECSQ